MIDQTYYLSMVPGGIPVRVPVSQYDAGAGRNIIFTLIGPNSQAFEVPSGATVTCDGTKKDKKAFSYVVTADGSTVTVPVEEQMTAAAGPVVCQITINSDGAVLGTANFVLDVERAAMADDADMSETDIATLQTWLAEAIAARDAAAASETAAADSATAASDSAATAKALADEASGSASAAAASALESSTAAANAASEAAEATAAEIKESIQTELDAKADQTDLDDAVENISTNTSNISSLQSSVSELNSNALTAATGLAFQGNIPSGLTVLDSINSYTGDYPAGIYRVQGNTLTEPVSGTIYTNLILLPYYSGQLLISQTGNAIYVRTYTGNPAAWNGWKKFSSVEDSGWITLPLADGVTAVSYGGGSYPPKYRKIGDQVIVQGSVSFTAGGSNSVYISSLPSGYRPSSIIYAQMPMTGSASYKYTGRLSVATSGSIYVDGVTYDGAAYYSGDILWAQINISFFI